MLKEFSKYVQNNTYVWNAKWVEKRRSDSSDEESKKDDCHSGEVSDSVAVFSRLFLLSDCTELLLSGDVPTVIVRCFVLDHGKFFVLLLNTSTHMAVSFPCLSQSKDSLGCLSYKCNPTLAKKGPAQRKRPKAAKIMATEVQSVRLWILLRKGRAKMKQIWLISFPENTQAVSCLTERVKKGWQFFSKPLIESQTVFQLWKGRQKDRRSPSLEQSPTMNRWLCRPVMKVFKTK